MADAITKIADILDPEIVNEIVVATYPDKIVLVATGAVEIDTNSEIMKGGQILTIPRTKIISNTWQDISETADLETKKTEEDAELGVVIRRGDAFSVKDTAELVSLHSPNKEVARQLSGAVAQNVDRTFMKVLTGAVPTPSNVLDITAEATKTMNISAIARAKQKIGDNLDDLAVICMHSKPFTDLVVQGIVEYKDAQNDLGMTAITGQLPTIAGLVVYVSDKLPVTTGVPDTYTTYILAKSSMYMGYQRSFNYEVDRDILAKDNVSSYDMHFIPHLRGMSWKIASPKNPSEAVLATAGSWELKAESQKLVKAVALITQ